MKKTNFNQAQLKEANAKIQQSFQHAISKPRAAYAKQRYNTPLFVVHEMLTAFQRHNVLGLSASLSFYAMFALIPLVLLLFFLLSHLVLSSDYAVVKLAIITGNLVPKFSNTIMLEVYNAAQQKAAWGALGIFVLLWAITPLAGAMRTTFYNISAMIEAPSYFKRKFKDMLAVLGMLILFFGFTFAGIMIEKVIGFIGAEVQFLQFEWISLLTSLALTTLLISAIYYVFFPTKPAIKHILIGAAFTATVWVIMRPAFGLFLSVNESYGSVFGGMKNLFISITWLYFNFAVFLLGTEIVAILRKEDSLLLKGLFNNQFENNPSYLNKLSQRYGKSYLPDTIIFNQGDIARNFYFVLNGTVALKQGERTIRTIHAGEYFGEMALLSNTAAIADAVAIGSDAPDQAVDLILIYPENIETLLSDEPNVAMQLLRKMATRLQQQNSETTEN